MPHIDITMYPGRSEELKAELAKNVRDCAAETLKMDKKYFSVSIEEVRGKPLRKAQLLIQGKPPLRWLLYKISTLKY